MKIDFLIVGQGLAGTLLADHLLEKGCRVHLIHNPELSSSSRVAGGMINPVTGKHLAKTWLDEAIFPYLRDYYRKKEAALDTSFFYEIPLYRPFKNPQQKDQFLKAIEKHGLEEYCSPVEPKYPEDQITNGLGGIQTTGSGRLDVAHFLDAMAMYFLKNGVLSHHNFNFDQLKEQEGQWIYESFETANIIFCEGFQATRNPYFNWLPFNPVKGETLEVELSGLDISEIVNQGVWLMPLENQRYKLGATYSWHELNDQITERGRSELLDKMKSWIHVPFEVKDQKAGVRPATKDRRPFMGSHPEHKNLFIFNGLGTKGVSLGPYFANEMTAYLTEGKELNPETTIERFYPLY